MSRRILWLPLLAATLLACSDDDSSTNCTDGDGDGYGTGADCLGTDCDDSNPSAWQSVQGYPDSDGDGHYAAQAEDLCVGADGLPSGYSDTAGDDCDDSDPLAWEEMQGYVDSDGDGVSAATAEAETLCTDGNLPDGYVAELGADCDDTDDSVFQEVSGYADLDGDGVYGDASSLVSACTDGSLPPDTQEQPGTDCDDFDPFATSSEPTCEFLGVCADTEGGSGQPDMRGIGACQSTDCNGTDSDEWEPMFQITSGGNPIACTTDDECGTDNKCIQDTCWSPNGNCQTGTLTCSEIPDCLENCKADNPDNQNLAAMCMQYSCYEHATPKAQLLYMWAQDCAAAAGCFAQDDPRPCVLANCAAEFGACMGDTP